MRDMLADDRRLQEILNPEEGPGARARDILSNPREGDCCDRGECMYPNLPEMAREVLELIAAVEALLQAAMHDEAHRAQLAGRLRSARRSVEWLEDRVSSLQGAVGLYYAAHNQMAGRTCLCEACGIARRPPPPRP